MLQNIKHLQQNNNDSAGKLVFCLVWQYYIIFTQ